MGRGRTARKTSRTPAVGARSRIKTAPKIQTLLGDSMIGGKENLERRLREASALYYGPTGQSGLSDAEWDALEDELRSIDPTNPIFNEVQVGAGSGWRKVKHPVLMGSLDKVQNAKELADWVKGFPLSVRKSGFVVMEKLDGISVLLTYERGVLVGAATRGDGVEGEEILQNVRKMEGVPPDLRDLPEVGGLGEGQVLVRGEIVCRKSKFVEHFKEGGARNARNTASGTAKRHDGVGCEHLTVVAYGLHLATGPGSLEGELLLLKEAGFIVPGSRSFPASDTDGIGAYYQEYIEGVREGLDWDIDGLVISIEDGRDREELDGDFRTRMRPRGRVALKFPHDCGTTELLGVTWQVGASGRLTPVAEFKPLLLAGAQVKQASLHNWSLMERLNLKVGAKILVSRRNDVIPYVEALVEEGCGDAFLPPASCPCCGSALVREGEWILCRGEDCSEQVLGGLKRWVQKVGILGLGEKIIEALVDCGLVKTVADLYQLDVGVLSKVEVEGRLVGGAARRIIESIDEHRELPLEEIVGSLGIPLCGRLVTKTIVDAGFSGLNGLLAAGIDDLAKIPGIGQTKAESFHEGFRARIGLIQDLLDAGVKVKEASPSAARQEEILPILEGGVCMTGFRSAEMEAEILKRGGSIKSGVGRGLSFLVAKDPHSGSGKAQKARDLSIPVVSIDQMWEILRGTSEG